MGYDGIGGRPSRVGFEWYIPDRGHGLWALGSDTSA